ncbi:MAG: hypothetical protein WAV30_05715 [Microgenomates group bacterium]
MEPQSTTPPIKDTVRRPNSLSRMINTLRVSQRPPELDPHTPKNEAKSAEYEKKTNGIFGNSKDLLVRFGLAENEAQGVADSLSSGEWMFNRDFLINQKDVVIEFHKPQPVSRERQLSGKEPFDLKEVPTAELQFNLSTMVRSAVESAHLDPSLTEKIMAGYTGLTRYKDFGLSLQFPVSEEDGQIAGNAMRLSKLQSQITDLFKNADNNAVIIGGWTSNINFAGRQDDPLNNGPENEASLSQQYLSRKKSEGKSSFVVSCAGPGMERNVFSDAVSYDEPFGPHDHVLGVTTAYTLLGKGNDLTKQMNLSLEGHSMGGAGMIAVLEHYKFPPNHSVSVTALHPSIAGTNAWANLTEQISKAEDPLAKKLGRKGLSAAISGGIDILDKTAEKLGVKRYYTPLKEGISRIATNELFLPGDKKNMPKLVQKHVDNFKTYTGSSTLSALGSISDLPIDKETLASLLQDEANPTKFVLVTDKDDQMVETENMLRQLPFDMPLFVLNDADEGSHYSFKRNCRSLRLGLLQQSMEQYTKPQFTYVFHDLFMKAYGEKLQGEAVSTLVARERNTIATQFDLTGEELDTYLKRRSEIKDIFVGKKPGSERLAFFDALSGGNGQRQQEIAEYYHTIGNQPDVGLKYFYSSNPERLTQAIMPEGTKAGFSKVELMIEALETLADQVHFNLPSDPLLKR